MLGFWHADQSSARSRGRVRDTSSASAPGGHPVPSTPAGQQRVSDAVHTGRPTVGIRFRPHRGADSGHPKVNKIGPSLLYHGPNHLEYYCNTFLTGLPSLPAILLHSRSQSNPIIFLYKTLQWLLTFPQFKAKSLVTCKAQHHLGICYFSDHFPTPSPLLPPSYFLIYLLLAALSLHCCMQTFSSGE